MVVDAVEEEAVEEEAVGARFVRFNKIKVSDDPKAKISPFRIDLSDGPEIIRNRKGNN